MQVSGTGLKKRGKKDLQFTVKQDGTDQTWKLTNAVVKGDLDAAFKQGNVWYLPITFVGTSASVLTITEA